MKKYLKILILFVSVTMFCLLPTAMVWSADNIKPAVNPESSSLHIQLEAPKERQIKKEMMAFLLKSEFRYTPLVTLPDPFNPFVKSQQEEALEKASLEEFLPPEPIVLTPLQRMEISEIQRGFKGVLWGPMGRRAIIEDGTGKGYLVNIGTPVGNQDGVVSAIFRDRIIIKQKVWDRRSKDFVWEEVIISLNKETNS